MLEKAFSREDVAEELANLMSAATTGPQASTLRHALRSPALDQHLERLAFSATQPSVRAVALGTLIDGRAEWPSRTELRWIDKSMGLRRHETVFDHRLLEKTPSRYALIKRGLSDKSPVVRRVALAGIIRHMLDTAQARTLAAPLVSDRSSSVREKAVFILRRKSA
ncbi:hypothetical protein MZO42_02945 [Sphingomonas psychrotolerans]|uniref:HEAT repeat domain-containing protein n=1 Tax=Sphingomonas psychrotolerans TaxID=1327635 RepID=A0ABU3MZB8_9SPHN|nr:hypothetical protein [Sphingomonas psychrotolerans]MDT8757645.1 hypothetical protein [Sphingomonas psychrotolerans]